ncbi:DUF1810 domain-containing protein [Marinovum algicola]|jgi:uncharacterized protein (DUF1810 family)|uniref:DUF1810 domain-containing protein n=1 Tax=Marinovum algicola TaxID=42444 RepID=UPI0024B95737|nr:DUF1810 domain-containing protein [Marinovum algicola]
MSLSRFIAAQDGVWEQALGELQAGRKRSHWMWFIFPQLASLGRSAKAQRYGLADLAEARAYAAHAVLGPRLREAGAAVLAHRGRAAEEILGGIDALKLRSCATLFERADHGSDVHARLIDNFYGGDRCPLTQAEIGAA